MLSVTPLQGYPIVQPGDALAPLVCAALARAGLVLEAGDIVVVASKIVSLSENRQVRLDQVEVSTEATRLAEETGKDVRLVELILRESAAVVRAKPGLIIARHRLGLVGANAGIDQSNIDHAEGECALLLPLDPDASAAALRAELGERLGVAPGVIVSDSMNRPWRMGSLGVAIGCAGIPVLDDRIGEPDLYGRTLRHTVINVADSLAAAAVLLMGETSECTPAALLRGYAAGTGAQTARDAIRPVEQDLFL